MTTKKMLLKLKIKLKQQGFLGLFKILFRKIFFTKFKSAPDESEIVYASAAFMINEGIMIDVGAHTGTSMAPFANKGWKIFAFEPDYDNRTILEESYKNNPNVKIDKRAISDEPNEGVKFYTSDISTGISGLSSFHDSHRVSSVVEVTTLSLFINNNQLADKEISYLKIDTEGFDLNVLKGFPWGSSKSPLIVVCEFEDKKTIPLGYNFTQMGNYLLEKGYKIIVSEWYPILEYGVSHKWRRFTEFPCQLEDENGWGNFIATTDDAIFENLKRKCGL